MKKRLLFAVILPVVLQLQGQDVAYAREVIKTLASPEFKGRGYVENGNRIAADYIKEQFISIGLKPFEKEFFQSFKIDVNTFPGRMELAFDGTELVPGKDFIVDPASPVLSGKFPVVVITKQNLMNPDLLRNAVQAAAGKMLVIDERTFTAENKDRQKEADDLVTALKFIPQVTSVGTIILTHSKLNWSTATQQAPKAVITVNSEADWSSLATVTVDIEAEMMNYRTQNIIGYVEGTAQPDSFLVVTAHYDHLGKMGKSTYFPGANDNASGVSMLLQLAKYYTANPHRLSVVFIALAAEEIGIAGAEYFVENPLFDLQKIKFLINFDLAGTGDDGIKVVNGSVYKEKFDRLSAINEANHYLPSVQIRGAACNSDHCMFYQKGVPCFYIYTLGGTTAYHDIYDRSETLPLTEFEDYSKLMQEFLNGVR